jgi:hypothetical protein
MFGRTPVFSSTVLEKVLVSRLLSNPLFDRGYPSSRDWSLAHSESEAMARDMGVLIEDMESLQTTYVVDQVLRGKLGVYSVERE